MGMLIDGKWQNDDHEISKGVYQRANSVYDQDIPLEVCASIQNEPGRYHLIASMSCQWSQRTLITRLLKGLDANIALQIAYGPRLEGYAINGGHSWRVPGSKRNIEHLHQLYQISDPAYTGTATVPVLWDSVEQRIVSNESAKIQRAFDAVMIRTNAPDFSFNLAPVSLLAEIDQLNDEIYTNLSNGVYRAGFAQSQSAYDQAVEAVFAQLDRLETRLSAHRYLLGNMITEPDINLFTTLVRFDAVYFVLHRCCRRRLVDYPNLSAYSREIYHWPGIHKTVDFDVIRESSYQNDTVNNPYAIIAVAADSGWAKPHHRSQLGQTHLMSSNHQLIEVDSSNLLPIGPI